MCPALATANPASPGSSEPGRVGFFGKMPGRGDFVRRDLPNAFVDIWDEWLAECIARSRAALGHHWTDAWLCAPVWRFALGGGLCGPSAWAGVMMPSVDSAGRYFPLTLVASVSGSEIPAALLLGGWIDALEDTALLALENEGDFDSFATAVSALPSAAPQLDHSHEAVRSPGTTYDPTGFAGLMSAIATPRGGRALFVTRGGGGVSPVSVLFPGLPSPSRFASLIEDGDTEGVIANALPQAPVATQIIPTDEFQTLGTDLPAPAQDTLFDDVAFQAAAVDALPPGGGAFDRIDDIAEPAVAEHAEMSMETLPEPVGGTLFDDAAFGAQAADPVMPTGGAFDDGAATINRARHATAKGGPVTPNDDLFEGAQHPALDNLFGEEDATAGTDRDTLNPPREAPR